MKVNKNNKLRVNGKFPREIYVNENTFIVIKYFAFDIYKSLEDVIIDYEELQEYSREERRMIFKHLTKKEIIAFLGL